MKVHAALFLVSLLYAILFSWAGEIMPAYISAEGFVWLRILTAFGLFSICSLFITDKAIDWKNDWKRFAVCAFFGTAANMFMFFKGLSMTKPINGAVLMLVTPLFVAIIEHVIQRKKPSLYMAAGISIGANSTLAAGGATHRQRLGPSLLAATSLAPSDAPQNRRHLNYEQSIPPNPSRLNNSPKRRRVLAVPQHVWPLV